MSVQLVRDQPKSKANWKRMNDANTLLWDKYKPDAVLKAGKGWLIQTLDAIHICEVFDANGVEYEKISEYKIAIL